ncbi:MAG: hypothetical protein ACOX9C_03580 [Kiritimatiellia bacterium]
MASEGVQDFVVVSGGGLKTAGAPARFLCATGVAVPMPAASEGDGDLWRTNWVAAAEAGEALVSDLRGAGFNMIRLGAIPAGDSGIQGDFTLSELHERFIHFCKADGLRIWAEVLHPATSRPASVADVDCLDDPSSAAAWTNAIASTPLAEEQMLAAPWDPRLEVLIQRRVRAWARSFNPYTGLRHADDPVFSLWSFEQFWWDDIHAPRNPLHPFFRHGLDVAWNSWLYERFPTDDELRKALPDIPEAESVERGNVRFLPSAPCPVCAKAQLPRSACPRQAMQDKFLVNLYAAHILRVVGPFSSFGESARQSPVAISYNLQHDNLAVGATARFGAAPLANADPMPLIHIVESAGRDDPLHLAAAAAAVSNQVSVLALPSIVSPAQSVFASQVFLSGVVPGGAGQIDLPSLAFVEADIPTNGAHVAFTASSVVFTNIVLFSAVQQDDSTATSLAPTPGRLVLSIQSADGAPIDSAKSLVLSAYAFEPASGSRLDVGFFVAFHGLDKKKVEAFALDGKPVSLKRHAFEPRPPSSETVSPVPADMPPAEVTPPPAPSEMLSIPAGSKLFRIRFSTPSRLLEALR